METRRQAVKSKGVILGLQGDLSRSASTQRLTTILGVGAFYTRGMAGNRAGGCDITMGDI